MTREEEIYEAANDFTQMTPYCEVIAHNSFMAGAIWSDKHPIKLWHEANEEPENNTHILIENSFFEDDLDYYSCHWGTSICPSWEEYVKEYNIKRWACIADLLL